MKCYSYYVRYIIRGYFMGREPVTDAEKFSHRCVKRVLDDYGNFYEDLKEHYLNNKSIPIGLFKAFERDVAIRRGLI